VAAKAVTTDWPKAAESLAIYARMPPRNGQGRRAFATRRTPMAQRGFWREIRCRHVSGVAAAYAVVGWLLPRVAQKIDLPLTPWKSATP